MKYHTFRGVAMNVQASLLLRALCEYPWRQRQYRDMELGKHLTKGDDGRWQLRYHGAQLKRWHRRGKENELAGVLSPENSAFLDEWLTLWRPFLRDPLNDLCLPRHLHRTPTGHAPTHEGLAGAALTDPI